MIVYVQMENGEVISLYSSPQSEEHCPGIEELDIDDPKVSDFIKKNNVEGFQIN